MNPGPRLFERALSGGFQLVDLSLPETSNYFQLGTEIAGFKTPEECLTQIKYYLSHPEERLAIVRAAQKRCISEHLYKHRIEKIFNSLAAVPSRFNRKIAMLASGEAQSKKVRILHVVHNYIGIAQFGGVEVYVDMLVRNLPGEYESLVYYPNRLDPSGK